MIYVVLGIAAVLAIVFGILFNQLIARRQMVKNGWADIDVQLKRRADLVPQLVSAVQGYAAHERQLFEDIAAKRTPSSRRRRRCGQARRERERNLSRPIGKLIAVAEAYPELKANQNFLELQKELADTENKIEMARRFYNGAVRELNTAVESFPSNLVAGTWRYSASAPFFEIDAAERRGPTSRRSASHEVMPLLFCRVFSRSPCDAGVAKEHINASTPRSLSSADGDIVVTETIDVTAEGDQIRHGMLARSAALLRKPRRPLCLTTYRVFV